MYTFFLLATVAVTSNAFIDSLIYFQKNSTCKPGEFLCKNQQCVPQYQVCDHNIDCKDSSDESDCDFAHCKAPDFFKCKNERCISASFICDGENDCVDFSDEEKCDEFRAKFLTNSSCAADEWQCKDKLCIPKEWVCNGESDCLDGTDESIGCSIDLPCDDGFRCSNGHCVVREWRCDGNDDCLDNSDEIGCDKLIDPAKCNLASNLFPCADGKNCIKLSQVCDNTTQCPDKSDESLLCKSIDVNCLKHNCSHGCVQLPAGPKCLCPRGYYSLDEKHCQDINECESFGICSQKCRNLPGSYECYCEENYALLEDKRSCKTVRGDAIMFFSSKTEVRAYSLRSEVYFPVAKNLKQVVGVDFDGVSLYWTDIFSEHESIMKSSKDGLNRELLVTSGLGAPEDLEVDYITKNIYFTDGEKQHIGVCNIDGTSCTVLVNKDIDKPRGIVLHPEEGEMYWTDWGNTPEIGRALMDGSNDTAFVSTEITWPNGLALDHPNARLYWTDAKLLTLESIRLDGTDRRVVLEGIVKHPYAIAVFENSLYWSDWATHSIQSCDKFTGKHHHTLIKDKKQLIYGISIYHPTMKKSTINPCDSAFCSDLCLLQGQSYACACPQDKVLNRDGKTCRSVEKKQQLILAFESMLVHVEHQILGKHEVTTMPTIVKKVGALAYNSVANLLYASDLETKKIVQLNLHTGDSEHLNVDDLGQVIAMDYDYLGNNLYWCDSERSTIEILSLNTMARTIILHDMNGETPESIALIPEEGVMFVAFRKQNKHLVHVDRLAMDGTMRAHSIEDELLGPVSLLYDQDLHRVFIADAGTGNIQHTNVEGDDRHGFRALQTAPIAIASLKTELFWANENSRRVYWADKRNAADNDKNKKITLDLPGDIHHMYLISITPKRISTSACQINNGNCSHLCLQSQKHTLCSCPVGFILDTNNNRTCTKRVECTAQQFHCVKSNACVLRTSRCDGANNCPHGEDEENCAKVRECPYDSFECADGECVKASLRCNGLFDCKDKSDERNCSKIESEHCLKGHFKCNNGKCVERRFVCDGEKDCEEGEDERNCESTSCGNDEFRCVSGSCIPKTWECDQDYDCPDLSDEHTECPTCSALMFTCTNGRCIDRKFLCDQEDDCSDGSDEVGCSAKTTDTTHCGIGEFPCASNTTLCLPESARCNGVPDCPHHEDEQKCSDCNVEEWTCANKKCVPTQWICDGSDDCGDKSDEAEWLCKDKQQQQNGNHGTTMKGCGDEDRFQCKNGQCVKWETVCNGEPNCFDGSDEEGACNTSCSLNSPCSQICHKTPSGPVCKCRPGFQLMGDGQTCQDINECQTEPPQCAQLCHNSPGSHECDCYSSFILKSDKKSCKAEGAPMSLIYVNDNQIRERSQVENTLKLIHVERTEQITGLDVDVDSEFIYYSIENTGTIHKINKETTDREHMLNVGAPQKLALDWITDNVYFVNKESSSQSISVCNFASQKCAPLITVEPHRQISALAVDAANNCLFYSLISWWVFDSPSYVIYKTNLDGTDTQELVKSTTGLITGLSVDLNKRLLFYVDQYDANIGKINYQGNENTVIAANLTRPVGLSFFEDHLYFLTTAGFMGKCRLFEPTNCDHFKLASRSTELFVVCQQSRQPMAENPCKNHTCSHLCIPANLHYTCLCEDGSLVGAQEKCALGVKNPDANDDKTNPVHKGDAHSSSNMGPVIAAVMISVCLLIFGVVIFFFLVRKRSTRGSFNIGDAPVEFKNKVFEHSDESAKLIHTPFEHEFENPMDTPPSRFIAEESENEASISNVASGSKTQALVHVE